jgi:hypothetical protein
MISYERAVAGALDDRARTRLLLRWEAVNPHLAGAHVADVLEMLDGADSDLDLIEAVLPGVWPRHPAAGLAARALIWGRPWGALRNLDPGDLARLLAEVET